MHDTGGCKYIGLDKEYSIEDLAAFHGHLGPNIVIGYRMGRYVRRYFCKDPFHLTAVIHCSGAPPGSCLVDGIQLGCGCTMGKRNIEIITDSEIKCEFMANGKKLVLRPLSLKMPAPGSDHYEELIEQASVDMFRMHDSELFTAGSN